MRKRRKRNRLEKQIEEAAANNQSSEELARLGKLVPFEFRVKYWRERFQKDKEFREHGRLPEYERAALLGMFMKELVTLNAEWFEQMAQAIRAHRDFLSNGPQDRIRAKLSNLAFWICDPPATYQEIAKVVGCKNTRSFQQVVNRMHVPHTTRLGGRPKKLGSNKAKTSP